MLCGYLQTFSPSVLRGAPIFIKKKTNPNAWEKWDMSPDSNHSSSSL